MDNPSNEQNEQSDKMPKFFLEKKGKPEKQKIIWFEKKICQDRTG